MATDKPKEKQKRPASRYERKQRQPIEASHARHRPPVHGCMKCRRASFATLDFAQFGAGR